MFHVASKQARDDLRQELGEYLAQYWEASEALRSGNLRAAGWFPEGCYPPALAFVGPLPEPSGAWHRRPGVTSLAGYAGSGGIGAVRQSS